MGAPLRYVLSMPTAASVTASQDLGNSFYQVALEIPAAVGLSAAGTPFYIQGSSNGTTFYRMAYASVNTASSGTNDFIIASNTTSRVVPIPNFIERYIRVEISATVTGATWLFNVIAQNTGS